MRKKHMQNSTILRKCVIILLAVSIGILLSSCLVKKKDVEKISRTTDTLRIYQSGDFIEYNVSAVSGLTGTISQGVLHIQWENNEDLIDPIDPDIRHTVLKETTTLTYGDTIDATVIRYISQIDTDPPGLSQGSIVLHAIDDGADLYWLYDVDNKDIPTSAVITPIIFDSPMAVGNLLSSSPLAFSVMEGCGTISNPNLCGTEIYQFNDSFTVDGDSQEITTNLGIFSNPFRLSFSGGILPAGSLALSVLGDFRHACGDSSETLSHNGNMFVMPELGIIQITNLCRVIEGTTDDVNYTITVRNTNINFP